MDVQLEGRRGSPEYQVLQSRKSKKSNKRKKNDDDQDDHISPSSIRMVSRAAAASYEEVRKQRLEENHKRMEQLNLHKLSQALNRKTSPSTTMTANNNNFYYPVKKAKPKSAVSIRRSSRMADKPPPNYKEYPVDSLRQGRRIYKRRDLLNRVYASDEDRVHAVERAEHLEQRLGSEYPAFIKPMLQSHVTGGFWLSFPFPFCKAHLSDQDKMFTLIDENGDEWQAKYLARKNGLSGGWRGFAMDHELVDGDTLIFQLIESFAFKVYIVRVNGDEGQGLD